MALPNLSALVPPTGHPKKDGFTKQVVVEEPPKSRDIDQKCKFKVCTDENKNTLGWNVRLKGLLFGEEVLTRYETPLPEDFKAEMIETFSDATPKQRELVIYHKLAEDGELLSSEAKTEHRHGLVFRERIAKQSIMLVDGQIAVLWSGSAPETKHLDHTLWLEDRPETCKDETVQLRFCYISMKEWANKLAAMKHSQRMEHRKQTLFDGYCQTLEVAFHLHDVKDNTGLAAMSKWIEDANSAAILVQMYQGVLRDVVRDGTGKFADDGAANREVYTQAGCSAKFDTKSGKHKQVTSIHQLIVDLKKRAIAMSQELGAYGGYVERLQAERAKRGLPPEPNPEPPRDENDVPSREELEAEWYANWNQRRSMVDYSK